MQFQVLKEEFFAREMTRNDAKKREKEKLFFVFILAFLAYFAGKLPLILPHNPSRHTT